MKNKHWIASLLVFALACYAGAEPKLIRAEDLDTGHIRTVATVGEDQVPYTITTIENVTDPLTWLKNTYSDEPTRAIHYLPESLQAVSVGGASGLAFKTWEINNYVQNLLLEKDGKHLLYSTPHGAFNPDGAKVFGPLLGLVLPPSDPALLDEFPRLDESDDHSATDTDETQSGPEADSDLNAVDARPHGSSAKLMASPFGTKVGSYNGVDAYSNGSNGYVSYQYNYYNNYNTGMKWQCVEYVNRYYKAIYNKQITGGNANTYYSNASSKGLNSAKNGSSTKPKTGMILCSNGGSYGHVAIIREVGSNYVKVIHQNWSNSSSDNSKQLSMTVKNGKYTISGFSSSYPVQGWLWPK